MPRPPETPASHATTAYKLISMDDDLLSRDAVDRNLLRITNERMEGRKLVGVKYDERSKSLSTVGRAFPTVGRQVMSKEVRSTSPHKKK